MEALFTTEGLIALLTLSALEIVLGIDNIIFIAIVAGRLPENQRDKARILGLTLAVVTRIALLFSLTFLMGLTAPQFTVFGHPFSGRDLVLLIGGLFLIAKATHEIHVKFDHASDNNLKATKTSSFISVLGQILALDIIFSLDSVITAVGMVKEISIMVAAVIISIGIMLIFSKSIVTFIDNNPTMKMLALSFLILVGVMLVAESTGQHINKAYIYFAMAFSLVVEMLNIRLKNKTLTK